MIRFLAAFSPIVVLVLVGKHLVIDPLQRKQAGAEAEYRRAAIQAEVLAQRLEELDTDQPPKNLAPDLVWSGPTLSGQVASIQTVLSDAASERGIAYSSIGAGRATGLGEYSKVSIRIETESRLEDLLPLIGALERHRPALRIETMRVRQIPPYGREVSGTPVYADLTVWGLAVPEEAE